jgi:hypothetical protein
MARYRIDTDETVVSIEVTEVGGQQEQLLEAFSECRTGRCSCPTDEYEKLSSMEVERADDLVRLRLTAKTGAAFNVAEIAACLDYTIASASVREGDTDR